jgi:hypothetical protein
LKSINDDQAQLYLPYDGQVQLYLPYDDQAQLYLTHLRI